MKHSYKKDYEVCEVERVGVFKTKYKKELLYKGEYYSFEAMGKEIKRMKWLSLGLICFVAAAFIGLGLLNNEASRKFYILLPYVSMFLPIYYGLLGTLKLLRVKNEMTVIELEQSQERMKKSSLCIMVLAIATMIGGVIYVVRNSMSEVMGRDYVFFAGILFIGCIACIILQIQRKYNITMKKTSKRQV